MGTLNLTLITLLFKTTALFTGSIAVTIGVVSTVVTLLAAAVCTFKTSANPNIKSIVNSNLLLILPPPQFNKNQINYLSDLIKLRINHFTLIYKFFGLISNERHSKSSFFNLRLVKNILKQDIIDNFPLIEF